MSKSKLGILLMIIGTLFTIFSFTLRLQKYMCCDSFAGVKIGSAIDVWINNYQQRYSGACNVCNDTGAIPNYYYIPIEFIFIGLIIFFIGFRIYWKQKRRLSV
ncbi:MAG: hypothetical protein WCS88_04265 [Patescibacteria group bacterium]|jgi:hypothetical protein